MVLAPSLIVPFSILMNVIGAAAWKFSFDLGRLQSWPDLARIASVTCGGTSDICSADVNFQLCRNEAK